jgi:hypothetical protein
VLPDGLVMDVKNRTYLTKKVNLIFDISYGLSAPCVEKKKNGIGNLPMPSSEVAGTGLEPMTFGL